MKGFINILKPVGMSSARAVSLVKHKLNVPCGHMGTLDPMASGVLPVGIYKTCRLFDYLLGKNKTYEAKFLFGCSTDTLDTTGKITDTTLVLPTEKEIKSVINNFIGEIDQLPPKYSAKCVAGKRGYQLARKGVEFELAPKRVTINDVEYLGQTGENEFAFRVKCKGGTYIRSLARDMGEALGSLAVMSALDRTEAGIFNYENGVSAEEFAETDKIEKYIIKPELALDLEKLVINVEQSKKILNGLYPDYGFKDGTYSVFSEEEFIGVGEAKDGVLRIKAYVG